MSIKRSKYKVCFSLGENLWSSTKISRFNKKKWAKVKNQKLGVYYPQKSTDQVHLQPSVYLYGNRLRAKQKLRKFYGNITEKHFQRLFKKSIQHDNLLGLLESRLDTILFRMNFVSTPFAARQLISHGSILVNGEKVNIKSTLLKPGDCIEVSKKAWPRIFEGLMERFQSEEFIRPVPNYIEVNFSILKGIFLYEPKLDEIGFGVPMNIGLVKEFYK